MVTKPNVALERLAQITYQRSPLMASPLQALVGLRCDHEAPTNKRTFTPGDADGISF